MKAFKRVIAFILVIVMLVGMLPLSALAADEGDDEQLRQQLQQAADETAYPNGLFELLTTRMNTSEDMSYVEIAVVRKGGTAGAASVTLKAIDVTAEYGEDYTLSVKDGLFYKTLPKNADAKPLIASIAENDENAVAVDVAQSNTEESGEASTDDISSETDNTGLRAMRDASVGNVSTQPNWRQVDDTQKDSALTQEKALYEGLPGECCTLNFADGEYIKKIRFNTMDDSISEDEEQVLFALTDPVGGVLGDSLNGFMNIEDNEEKEALLFEMADSDITADPDTGYAEVTVKRTAGLYRYGSVYVGTAAVSAQPGVDYDPIVTELRFVPGQETQTVQVPLLSADQGAGLQFYVRLDPNGTGAADPETGKTLITIGAPEAAMARMALKSADTAASNSVSLLSYIGYEENYRVKTLTVSDITAGNYSVINNTAYVPVYGTNGSNSIQFDADLTMVDKISWYWSNPYSGYYKGWGWTNPVYYQDFSSTVTVCEDTVAQQNGTLADSWGNYTLPASYRQPTSIRFISRTQSQAQQSQLFVNSVKLYYTPITVRLETDKSDPNAKIIPKTFTSSGNSSQGASVFVGGLSFGGDTSGASEKVFYDGDTVSLLPQYADTQLTDTSKVYLWGYKIERTGSNGYYSVEGDSLNIRALYTGKMMDSEGNKIERDQILCDHNTVVIRPIYKARTAFVKISFDETKGGMAQNSFENGVILRMGMLDTVALDAYADKGYSVTGYNSANINFAGASVTDNNMERDMDDHLTDRKGSEALEATLGSREYSRLITSVSGLPVNEATPNELNFTPGKTFTELTVQYGVPAMKVIANPKSSDNEKGTVLYSYDNTILTGDSQTPMIISPLERNKVYTISGLPQEGYRMRWADYSGDTNEDGYLTYSEYQNIKKYESLFNRTAVFGAFYNYVANYDYPLIYYSFEPKPTSSSAGMISEHVVLVGGSVLQNMSAAGAKSTETDVVGAQVLVNGHSAETGEDGTFTIFSNDFITNESYAMIISYNGVNYKGYANVNAASEIQLQEYDDFIPYNFTGYETVKNTEKGVTTENTQELEFNAVGNGDTTYTFHFEVSAQQPGISAQKAIIHIYSKDGVLRYSQEVLPQNGSYTFSLNPAAEGVLPGDTMTLQLVDQYGETHLEHDVGFSFVQKLDTISLMTSFQSPVSGAIDMVGSLDTAFNMGLSGELDGNLAAYESRQGHDLIIAFGFDKSWEKDIEDSGKEEDEALKEAAGSADTELAKDTAKDAVSKGDDNKTSASLTNSMQFGLSTAIYLKLSLDTDPTSKHYQSYYFNEMIISATVSGSVSSKVEIQTPIGVTVFVQLKLGGDITALMAIEKYKKNVYFDESGSVDFSNASDTDPDRDFTIYGKFIVQPYIEITVGASLSVATLTIDGRATFDMNFTTLGTGHGSVSLSSELTLTVACFNFNWKIQDKSWDLFNYGSVGLNANSIFSGEEYLYDNVSSGEVASRDYLVNRGTWQSGGSSGLLKALSASNHSGNEQTLLTGVYPYPYTCLADLGDNRQLLVFLDDDTAQDDRNRTQLYYSLNTDGTWSVPKKLDTDNTPDSLPCVYDLGDSILVAWSSAYAQISESDDVLDALNKNNIKSSFFSKDTLTFGDVQEVTQQTADDIYSDTNPYIAFDDTAGTKNLMIVYTKSQYASTDVGDDGDDENAVVGDVVNPYYTALAYRFYDFDKNCWSESGGDQNYYGQSFIDASQYVDVDESSLLVGSDEDPSGIGYWSRTPTNDEISIKTFANNDPLIVDSDAIGYGGYAVLAYAVDTDSDFSTTSDRELFIQLYDFENHVFFPAIRIPEEQTSLSNLVFDQSNDNVYLYYLSDGDIRSINIGYLVNQELQYYEDKGAFVVNKQKDVYQPSQVVAKHPYDLVTDEDGNKVRQNEMPIDEFMVKSDDNNVYIVWGESNITYKDGVDPNSEEAADPENYYREHQIYAVRQTIGALTEAQVNDEEGNPVTISYRPTEWSDQVKLTDEQGANYNDLDFVILADGSLRVVYVKGMSQVTDVSGEQMSTEDVNSRVLMTADFETAAQKAEVNIKAPEAPQPGEILPVVLNVDNQSFSSLNNVTVSLVQLKDGIAETVDEQSAMTLKGGETTRLVFSWQAPDELSNTDLQAIVSDGDTVLCSVQVPIAADSSVDITDVTTNFVGRDQLKIQGTATNNGTVATDDAKITAEAGGVQIGSFDLGRVEVGETKTFEFYGDTSAVNFTNTASEDGAVTESAKLSVYADGSGETLDLTRAATAADMALINDISTFTLKDGNNIVLENGTVMTKGSTKQILPDIAYQSEDHRTPHIVYTSSDESVADFGQDEMTLNAKKTGTTTVTACLLPPDSVKTLSKNGYAWTDNLSTLPDAAILTKTFTVTVANDSGTSSDTTESTTDKTGTAEVTAEITGNVGGCVTASVGENQIKTALNETAKSQLIIHVNAPDGTKAIDTDIPASALRLVAENGTSALTLKTSRCTVSFDADALSTICGEAAGDSVRISAAEVDPSILTEAARAAIGDRPVFSFTVTSGDNTISELNGHATVSIPYTPKAGEDTDAIVIYYINADGLLKTVADCAYDPESGAVIFRTDHFSDYAIGYHKVGFSDVQQDAWYADAVNYIAARDITTGTGDGCFSPDAPLTRGQFTVMLLRTYGIAPAEDPTDNFTDAGNTYYTDYLAAAKQLGIAGGIGDNLFAPDREVTRQEMCTLLYHALILLDRLPEETSKETPADFLDEADIASWASDAITAFVKAEVLNGSNRKLLPTGILSRAQMAQIFYKLMKN
ncbi:MAG: S-layer homology domain-containing protein [Lawsonibacter sp.]|nr:S-layer homology domain-containing protein [Lawsonibacter sp.]